MGLWSYLANPSVSLRELEQAVHMNEKFRGHQMHVLPCFRSQYQHTGEKCTLDPLEKQRPEEPQGVWDQNHQQKTLKCGTNSTRTRSLQDDNRGCAGTKPNCL